MPKIVAHEMTRNARARAAQHDDRRSVKLSISVHTQRYIDLVEPKYTLARQGETLIKREVGP